MVEHFIQIKCVPKFGDHHEYKQTFYWTELSHQLQNYLIGRVMHQVLSTKKILVHLSITYLVLGGPVPPLYTGFPGVRASVRVRKLMEAKSAMTMKIKVASLLTSQLIIRQQSHICLCILTAGGGKLTPPPAYTPD